MNNQPVVYSKIMVLFNLHIVNVFISDKPHPPDGDILNLVHASFDTLTC